MTHCSYCFIQSLLRAELDGLRIAVQASPMTRRCNERPAACVSRSMSLLTTFSAGFQVGLGQLIQIKWPTTTDVLIAFCKIGESQ